MKLRHGGRDAAKEREVFVSKVTQYLERHAAGDSGAQRLSYSSIARTMRVSRGHFAKADEDPVIAELVRRIQLARSSGVSTPPPPARRTAAIAATAEPGASLSEAPPTTTAGESTAAGLAATGLCGLELNDLNERILRHASEARRAAQMWVGRARAAAAPEDAPLLLHDLEKLVRTLRIQVDTLRPLVEEQQRRIEPDATDGAASGDQGELAI